MLHRPNNRVNDQLLMLGRNVEQGREAILINRLEELKKSNTMLREIFKVLGNHLKSHFKNSVHDSGDVVNYIVPKLFDYSRKEFQHFGISRSRNVALIVTKDRVKDRRNDPLCNRQGLGLRRPAVVYKDN